MNLIIIFILTMYATLCYYILGVNDCPGWYLFLPFILYGQIYCLGYGTLWGKNDKNRT